MKNDKYYQFRKKGVNPELSELWDEVFGQTVASGKNVISPTMDAATVPEATQDQSPLLLGDIDFTALEDDDYNLDDEDSLNTLAALVAETSLFEPRVGSKAVVATDPKRPSK